MEIPEIQYQPGQVSPSFQPVKQVDITPALRENQQRTANEMQQNLAQMQRNGQTMVQNVRDQAFPVEKLAQFSKTLSGLLDEKAEQMKEDLQNEVAYDVFMEGLGPTKDFEDQEKQFDKDNAPVQSNANTYERETGDVEGAERIRNMTGWRGYYYKKAKAEQHGNGFGSFMTANAENPDYAVNGFTLASAPDAATRQAVAAKMASNYMAPYSGMNKSFLAKYMFPGMRKGMASATATYNAKAAERIKANRLDSAKQALFTSSDKATAMQNFRSELTAMGYSESEIRGEMVKIAGTFSSKSQLDAFLDAPYGPNGKSFREQYPLEAQQATEAHYTLQQSISNNNARQRKLEDTESLEEAMALVAQDKKDGSFDARPERLQELAETARATGREKTAAYWESQIAETAYMKSSETLKKQYETQIAAGVVPQDSEILQNPALSQKHKQELLGKGRASGKSEPTDDLAKGHKEIIKDSIQQRGKYSPMQSNHPGIAAMEMKAWMQYKSDYNAELKRNGGDTVGAAEHALNNFKKAFGTDDYSGEYGLISAEMVTKDPSLKGRANQYFGYNPNASTSPRVSPIDEIRTKTEGPNAFMSIEEAMVAPDLYTGEDAQLAELRKSFQTTGVIGTIPSVYYGLQQKLGGKVSIMDLVNKRLEVNGYDPLPKELNNIIKPVEDSFDDDTYAYISYKPNATRTDIGVVASGGEPIYAQSTAAQEEIKSIFGKRESPNAGYDAMNRGTGGDSPGGGTKNLGRPLTSMTLGEIKRLQASGQLFAAGRYQFIPATLIEAAQAAGVTDDMPFNEAVQDRIFFTHLDRYGAHGPWEQWWIQQGGEHLRLTPAEKQKIEAFRESYDPSQPWRQAKNTRGDLLHVYTSGNIGPTSTGAHLDVKQVGGGRFEETALDSYVVVHDPEFGDVSLGDIRKKTGGIGDNFDEHVARGSHGIDYGLHSGTKISIKGGAKVVRTVPSIHGDVLTIQVPDGRQFTFIHGTSAS